MTPLNLKNRWNMTYLAYECIGKGNFKDYNNSAMLFLVAQKKIFFDKNY